MTGFSVERLDFSRESVAEWERADKRFTNWPVVYVLNSERAISETGKRGLALRDVYVGETLNAASRMRQHLSSRSKDTLSTVRVLLDPTFNKSVCLDLESYLISLLSGDGSLRVLNRNDGITEANYYDRAIYRESFREVFEALRAEGIFSRALPEIENGALFKLSPFKALNEDQAAAVEDIVEGLLTDVESGATNSIVIQGAPGTGKTVVAIFLLKLLVDIAGTASTDEIDPDSRFAEFFVEGNRQLLTGLRVGLVIPQQSLRKSVQSVFRKTPGLDPDTVMTAFQAAESVGTWDLLIVDEAHRLNQRANQPTGVLNAKFKTINEDLFGEDDVTRTQLDWIRAKSQHSIFLVDAEQSVRPADLAPATVRRLVEDARAGGRLYPLRSQMRVQAGSDYVSFVRRILQPKQDDDGIPKTPEAFEGYDFRMFEDVQAMHDEIRRLDDEVGLARMVAGFAWKWSSKNDKSAIDIRIGEYEARWNGTAVDWIASPGALDEVGSIHTVQGYDLNYAGVIIGPDLRYDKRLGRLVFHRESYFDPKGTEKNKALGITYSDDDILRFVCNVYTVLLTRGIRGTFVYVCDPALREYLATFIPSA
ncbi:DUF2075 domain-containing protein [Frondihabitans australicus]|uniref:GIY-YIG domain-containing protein n=1 Tax=Frondihabitans australicus TaxID=386892 RepID=A0A495IDT1_9MICO|nr:DUF2075 domain-containing protein [Frondihabitans australicus]RKR73481.1 hypothetical protein C8E83_0574 [Frondihabitans australicus]